MSNIVFWERERGVIRFSEDCSLQGKNEPEVAGDPSQWGEQSSLRVPSQLYFLSSSWQLSSSTKWILVIDEYPRHFFPVSMFGDWHMQLWGLTLVPGDPLTCGNVSGADDDIRNLFRSISCHLLAFHWPMKLPISQHCSDIGPINSKLQSSTSHSKYLTGKIFRIILCLVNCLFFCPFFALWHPRKILHLLGFNLGVSITCFILVGRERVYAKILQSSQHRANEC